ncbi:MAG: toll/interleukin-1 receptor domain-containing protein [Christensenellaceae bacterium]|nr:toll/interleukin-1 receptor domain-containing protein [Christensenellaceae bacterium]
MFNQYRDILNIPLEGRILNNFALYRELFNNITVVGNRELNAVKANLYFFAGDYQFDWVMKKDNYIDIYIDLQKIDAQDFDEFIFGRKNITDIVRKYCNSVGVDFIGIDLTTTFENAYGSWDSYLNRIGYDEENLINSPETDKMKTSLLERNIVWCHNKSCSGKTYTAIKLLLNTQRKCVVYNPCFQLSCDYNLVKLLLAIGKNFSLLVDDIQCDVEKAKELLDFVYNNANSFVNRNIKVFIVSWSSLLIEDDFKWYSTVLPTFTTNPNDYIELLRTKIKNKSLLSVCGDNIALLNAASKVAADASGNLEEHLFKVFVHTSEANKLVQIHKLCVLGIYEYTASKEFLGLPVISVDDFNTLKIAGTKYYAGHREICQFVASYIEQLEIPNLSERRSIIREYIMSVDNAQKWRTLKQLVGGRGAEDLNAISPIWNTLYCFEQEIKTQTEKDPSWSNTPSSMYFVLNTASLLGVAEDYIDVLKSFCDKFSLSDQQPFISLKYDEIKTTNDFLQIRTRMIDEDSISYLTDYETGSEFDCASAHKNWVLGLIVGLKKELIDAGYESLYDNAIKELFRIQNSEGFWYPKRVPWVTARIIIGLSQAGYSVANDHVKNAIDYFFNILGNNSFWEAHTGGWNSIYETSSLCLEAIFRSGYYECNKQNEAVSRVTNYLLQNKGDWMAENNEIDGSATTCSLLKIVGIKKDLLQYITDLCERCIFNTVSENETLDFNQVQSCNTTQIASYIIELCWYIFERDLPSLLENFVSRSSYRDELVTIKEHKVKSIFISYSEDSVEHIEKIRKISDKLKNGSYKVYFYADEPVGINNIKFMRNGIEQSDIILVIGTLKYKEKATNMEEGGVFFENNVISAVYMQNQYEKIVPIAFDKFSDSFPLPFSNNKGLRCKRIDKNFLNKILKEINKKTGGIYV